MNILIQPNTSVNTRHKPYKCLKVGDVFTVRDPFSEDFDPLKKDKSKINIYIKVSNYYSLNLYNGAEFTINNVDMVYDVTDICNIVLTR